MGGSDLGFVFVLYGGGLVWGFVLVWFGLVWFLQFQQCSGAARAAWWASGTTFSTADSLALLPCGVCIRHILAMAPRHRLRNIKSQVRAERWQNDALSSSCAGGYSLHWRGRNGLLGGEARAQATSPRAGDRPVDVFVGKGTVHWLRTSCKHGATKDHRGGQLASQSWMSHFSSRGFA